MKIILSSNDIHEVLGLTKADNISFINKDGITLIVAEQKDVEFKNQVVKKIYGYGDPGQTLINRNILKLVPKYCDVEITEDTIITGNRKIKYKPNDLVDGLILVENYLTTIPARELNRLLSCGYAMYTSIVRPILCGMCINNGEFAALDGFRLATRQGNFTASEQVVMDLNLVNVLKKIKQDSEVNIYYDDNYVKFEFGDLEIIGGRQIGNYFNYKSIIPQYHTTNVSVETKPILDVLKDYKKNKFDLVKLNFTENTLIISANNKFASIEDNLCINLQGDPIQIAFNPDYLIDCFKNYEIATLELTASVNPMVVKENNKLDLILPVRIVGGEA